MIWNLEWKIVSSSFGRVIDSLELVEDKEAAWTSQESAMAAQRLDSPVIAHDES
jgi:hypothetical protein